MMKKFVMGALFLMLSAFAAIAALAGDAVTSLTLTGGITGFFSIGVREVPTVRVGGENH